MANTPGITMQQDLACDGRAIHRFVRCEGGRGPLDRQPGEHRSTWRDAP